jgi:spoIIIJ-associated protein
MKDRVFTGGDVPTAVAMAAATLGLPESELRYVVLDAGRPSERGLQPTPARVAVFLEGPPTTTRSRAAVLPGPEPPAPPADARAGIRETVRQVAEAAGIDVWAEIAEDDDRVLVQLDGPDHPFFFGPDERGEVLRATEHVIQRMFGAAFLPRPLRVECRGFQERRDAALAEGARLLAEAVREDGTPRSTEPLNSYERRVVHMTLTDDPGVTTYSVGEGAARRVTVAPAEGPADDPA